MVLSRLSTIQENVESDRRVHTSSPGMVESDGAHRCTDLPLYLERARGLPHTVLGG